MAIDITVEAKTIDFVKITGSGYSGRLEVDLGSVELSDTIEVKTIIAEYGSESLLEEIGEQDVKGWLEEQGYSVSEGDAL